MRPHTDLEKARPVLKRLSGVKAEEMGVSRATRNALRSDQSDKHLLWDPFKGMWSAYQLYGAQILAEQFELAKAAMPEPRLSPLLPVAVSYHRYTNAAELLVEGAVAKLRQENPDRIGLAITRHDPSIKVDEFLALPTKLDRIRLLKDLEDKAALAFPITAGPGRLQEIADAFNDPSVPPKAEFAAKNPALVLGEGYGFATTSTRLVVDNSEPLEYVKKALMPGDAPSANKSPMVGLESLVSESEEIEKLNRLVNQDLKYDGFQVMYAPIPESGNFKLVLEDRDYEDDQYLYTQTTLDFKFPIRRVAHCLVITEPQMEAVVVRVPQDFTTTVRAQRDQTWDQTGFTICEGGASVSLKGVDELLDACSDELQIERWKSSAR